MGGETRVLVVDDDRRMVRTICDILNAKGFEASPALTGEDAVAMLRAMRPDCVLMDVRMPGIDGVETLRMMKELAPDLPVILMSAFATAEQAEEAKKHGAHAILTKPIDIQLLLSFLSLLRKEECILVVDDDPLFSKTLKDILHGRNFRVETEDDPGRAMALMEEKYELAVLLDLKLGNEDGLNLLRDIRSRYPTKPVLLVTAYREEMASTIEKGLDIGAYTCLYKPLEMEELIGIIEGICMDKLRSMFDGHFQS